MTSDHTPPTHIDKIKQSLAIRHAKARRFKLYGLLSIILASSFLLILLTSITYQSLPAWSKTEIRLQIDLDPNKTGLTAEAIASGQLPSLLPLAKKALLQHFPDAKSRKEKRAVYRYLSNDVPYALAKLLRANPDYLGQTIDVWVLAGDQLDWAYKTNRRASKNWAHIDYLAQNDLLRTVFNRQLFTNGDSRSPELAGIRGALVGSFYTLLITLALSFPIGVGAAIYLEEFSPRNWWVDIIETNINNLAAVPSIVFGILGLAIIISLFELPRSIPLVGGIVLSLMTLPTIIIATRAALKSVPPSIRQAALGIGASKMQMVFHHIVPSALPAILTGTIIGMAQALGETAPLLMIGMVAFIVDVPTSIFDPSTVLPVQIYLWADSPEKSFTALTSAAIVVLLSFLITMNAFAVWLRKRSEKK